MTGQELFDQLAALTPEQRKLPVLIEGENKWRNAIYNSTNDKIRVERVNEDGDIMETVYDEEDDGPFEPFILIDKF